eukprot:14759141-Ditylum_brightwellii.AAC.1
MALVGLPVLILHPVSWELEVLRNLFQDLLAKLNKVLVCVLLRPSLVLAATSVMKLPIWADWEVLVAQ